MLVFRIDVKSAAGTQKLYCVEWKYIWDTIHASYRNEQLHFVIRAYLTSKRPESNLNKMDYFIKQTPHNQRLIVASSAQIIKCSN